MVATQERIQNHRMAKKEKSRENGEAVLGGLEELGFKLTDPQREEVRRGKDFVQIKSGPFDLDLVFAPDGIVPATMTVKGSVWPFCRIRSLRPTKSASTSARFAGSIVALSSMGSSTTGVGPVFSTTKDNAC